MKSKILLIAAIATFLAIFGFVAEPKCYTLNGGLFEKPC